MCPDNSSSLVKEKLKKMTHLSFFFTEYLINPYLIDWIFAVVRSHQDQWLRTVALNRLKQICKKYLINEIIHLTKQRKILLTPSAFSGGGAEYSGTWMACKWKKRYHHHVAVCVLWRGSKFQQWFKRQKERWRQAAMKSPALFTNRPKSLVTKSHRDDGMNPVSSAHSGSNDTHLNPQEMFCFQSSGSFLTRATFDVYALMWATETDGGETEWEIHWEKS